MYLRGSLLALDPEVELSNDLSVDQLVRQISSELVELDHLQLRGLGRISSVPDLPVEILARIVDSKRISKEFTKTVLVIRSMLPPSRRELDVLSRDPSVTYSRGKWSLIYEHRDLHAYSYLNSSLDECSRFVSLREWSLIVDDRGYVLEYRSGEQIEDEDLDGETVEYSIYDYQLVYQHRECNTVLSVRSLLRKISASDLSISEACAWIVQLSYDAQATRGTEHELQTGMVMRDESSLRDELQRLVSLVTY